MLHGDGLRVRQIIINMMNNAIKFTETGYVKLSIAIEEKQMRIFCLRYVSGTPAPVFARKTRKIVPVVFTGGQSKEPFQRGDGAWTCYLPPAG